MADIINMPNPEPKGGSGLGLVAGLGLLGAGLYIAYRKLRGNTSAPGTGDTGTGGGGFWSEVFGGGSSSSGTSPGTTAGTPTGTTSPVPQIQQTPISSTNTGSTGSASSAYAAVKTTTYGVDDYKPLSSSVSSFLAAGRTDEEKSALSTMLKAADALSPDYYVLESTRNGTPVYNVISGTTGQIVGGGAGISYADAVAGGYERRDNLLVITPPGDKTSQGTQSSNAAKALVQAIGSGSSGTSKSSGSSGSSGTSKSSGSTSKSSGSSGSSGGGSAVSSFVNTVKSGGTSSGSTSGSSGSSGSSGKTVTTSTGFTLTSKVNTNNSAISFLRNRK